MNYRMIARVLGLATLTEAVFMLPPLLIAVYYGEPVRGFVTSIGIMLVLGMTLMLFRPVRKDIYAREGFVAVSFSWILLSLLGAMPFTIDGAIPGYISAVFETVSGFTTTGATVLADVESVPNGLLFWRSFTHWFGGMGVLVFMLAVLPLADDRSMHIMRAEVPGPVVGKLVPRARNTAMILYGIYIFLTALEVIFLLAGGMPLFDAVVHSFGTAGTGGFGIKNTSIAYYNSAYIDVVISTFMLLFSLNFNLYYLILLKNIRSVFKNEELRWFLVIVAGSVIAIAINISRVYATFSEALRYSLFQVASIISTTGYSTADFNLWPELSRSLLVAVMLIGACAGSTGGGIKVSRIVILVKSAVREVRRMMHPRSVNLVKMDGKTIPEEVVYNTQIFFSLYIFIMVASVLAVACFDECDFTTNVTGVIACMSNIGPGLGVVGPAGNFSSFTDYSKIILIFDMLLGRLEIFPIIMIFSRDTWKRV